MPTKVTKAEVLAVLNNFRDRGQEPPGLHRLRAAIGHGSLARLKRLSHEIELERTAGVKDSKKLPDPISAAAARVWAEIEAASDEQQQAIENNLAKAQKVMRDELEGMRRTLEKTEASLTKTAAERDTVKKSLQEAHAEEVRLTAELKTAEAIQAGLRDSLDNEREQARARERESKERFAAVKEDAQKRENDLQAMLAKANREAAEAAKEARKREDDLRGQLEGVTEQAAKAHASHVQYAATAEAKQEHLIATLAKRDATIERLGQERNALTAEVLELEKLVGRSEARQDALADELKHVRQDLAGAQQMVEAMQKAATKAASVGKGASKPRKTK